jgi:hypothetical protein
LDDLCDELLSSHRAAIQCIADGVEDAHELRLGELDEFKPGAESPDPGRAHRGGVEGQVRCGDQVESAAHQPGLHERSAPPQGGPHIPDLAVDANADLKLGRGHHLRLRAAEVADHAGEVLLRRPPIQVMTGEPEGVHLLPAHLRDDTRFVLQDKRQ